MKNGIRASHTYTKHQVNLPESVKSLDLSDNQKYVFSLHLQGYSQKEIADIKGVSTQAIQQTLSKISIKYMKRYGKPLLFEMPNSALNVPTAAASPTVSVVSREKSVASKPTKEKIDYDGVMRGVFEQFSKLPWDELMKRLIYIAYSPVPTPMQTKIPPERLVNLPTYNGKTCLECGEPFLEGNKYQKYCCVTCREKHYRDQRIAFQKYCKNQTANNRSITINL